MNEVMEKHFVSTFNKVIEEAIEELGVSVEDLREVKIIRRDLFFQCLTNDLINNMLSTEKEMFWNYFEREFGSLAEEL
jgi:hypothetical protein